MLRNFVSENIRGSQFRTPSKMMKGNFSLKKEGGVQILMSVPLKVFISETPWWSPFMKNSNYLKGSSSPLVGFP